MNLLIIGIWIVSGILFRIITIKLLNVHITKFDFICGIIGGGVINGVILVLTVFAVLDEKY